MIAESVQCAVCGYLSFGFTDGLMLRWYGRAILSLVLTEQDPWSKIHTELSRLLNYTPLATVIRLISLNCMNLWFTMFIISFTGYDPELYLLAWIIIASVCPLYSSC